MVQFVNMRELKIHASDVIRRTRKGDVVVTVRGKPQAVIHALQEGDLQMTPAVQKMLRRPRHSAPENLSRSSINLRGELKKVVDGLKRKYQPEKIILFGSLAQGNAARDIDLVVIKQTSKSFTDRLREVALLHQSRVGVDIFVYTPQEWEQMQRQGDQFISKEIIRKGRVLYHAARKR